MKWLSTCLCWTAAWDVPVGMGRYSYQTLASLVGMVYRIKTTYQWFCCFERKRVVFLFFIQLIFLFFLEFSGWRSFNVIVIIFLCSYKDGRDNLLALEAWLSWAGFGFQYECTCFCQPWNIFDILALFDLSLTWTVSWSLALFVKWQSSGWMSVFPRFLPLSLFVSHHVSCFSFAVFRY